VVLSHVCIALSGMAVKALQAMLQCIASVNYRSMEHSTKNCVSLGSSSEEALPDLIC